MKSKILGPLTACLALAAAALAASDFLGPIKLTTVPGYVVKGVTIGNYGADYMGTGETPILQALAAGHKHLELVNGTFNLTAGISTALDDITIEARSGVRINSAPSGAIGAFELTGDNVSLINLKITGPATFVNSQRIISVSTSKRATIRDCTITFSHAQGAGSTSTPMIGFESLTNYALDSYRNLVYPGNAVTGFYEKESIASRWVDCGYMNKVSQETPNVPTPVTGGYVGFYSEDNQFNKISNFAANGIGSSASGFGYGGDTSTRPKAMIWMKGVTAEDGHGIIENFESEMTACENHILLEGVQGWTDIVNPRIGFAAGGQYKLGEGGIKITNNVAAGRNSYAIRILGGRIHNLGNSAAASGTMFTFLKGVADPVTFANVMTGGTPARVDVTDSPSAGTANNFHLNTGSWSTTPAVGEFIRSAAQTTAANNGYFKVVFADANDITVDKTLIKAGALTNEVGNGDELITGFMPFESCGVWIDNSSDIEISDLIIQNQRHMWGIALDGATIRGVRLDDITFHRANENTSDHGAVAPIRILSSTLPNIGAGVNDSEGLLIGAVTLMNWGATPLVSSNGAWDYNGTTFSTTAPTITTTNAPFFNGSLGTAATNFDPAGAGVATNNLTLVRRLN